MSRTLIKNATLVSMDSRIGNLEGCDVLIDGEKIAAVGAEPFSTSQRDAQQFMATEVARWTKVIRGEKISPQD